MPRYVKASRFATADPCMAAASVVTKRRSSWACIGNPKPEQETIEGTHAQETPAYQRRPTSLHTAQGSNPPIRALYLLRRWQLVGVRELGLLLFFSFSVITPKSARNLAPFTMYLIVLHDISESPADARPPQQLLTSRAKPNHPVVS